MEALYLVAILPPGPVDESIWQLKQEFAESFPSFKSTKVLPHITLVPPFREDSSRAGFLAHDLTVLSSDCRRFALRLNGFQHFGSHTIYADVDQNEALAKLLTRLNRSNAQPHMTIGYKNRDRFAFPKAWNAFKDRYFEAFFTVDSYWLLCFERGRWQRLCEIPLVAG
ncbi:2'-5' RNA ligase family protein [Taibaiella helva]|uniref:2'-5' RNA ligase family protein n=1 Tax=Taibaiella helva TaxID=2301235 RepID=UPI000E585C45|nr:2'-5' RNA ligase family protein [Taibaiella helva]